MQHCSVAWNGHLHRLQVTYIRENTMDSAVITSPAQNTNLDRQTQRGGHATAQPWGDFGDAVQSCLAVGVDTGYCENANDGLQGCKKVAYPLKRSPSSTQTLAHGKEVQANGFGGNHPHSRLAVQATQTLQRSRSATRCRCEMSECVSLLYPLCPAVYLSALQSTPALHCVYRQ